MVELYTTQLFRVPVVLQRHRQQAAKVHTPASHPDNHVNRDIEHRELITIGPNKNDRSRPPGRLHERKHPPHIDNRDFFVILTDQGDNLYCIKPRSPLSRWQIDPSPYKEVTNTIESRWVNRVGTNAVIVLAQSN